MTPTEMRIFAKSGQGNTDAAKVRAKAPYVWDLQDEFDRPLTKAEIRAGALANAVMRCAKALRAQATP